MAQVLLSLYCKHFDESKRGWGRDRQAQQIKKTTISLTLKNNKINIKQREVSTCYKN